TVSLLPGPPGTGEGMETSKLGYRVADHVPGAPQRPFGAQDGRPTAYWPGLRLVGIKKRGEAPPPTAASRSAVGKTAPHPTAVAREAARRPRRPPRCRTPGRPRARGPTRCAGASEPAAPRAAARPCTPRKCR